MVSLDTKTTFLQGFEDSPYKPIIKELLSESTGSYSHGTSDSINLALNLLISAKTNDKESAEKYYELFQRRTPNIENEWIYDNFVIFSIVAAVTKFGLSSRWISDVINLSFNRANSLDKEIRESLKNILAGNYNAKNDLHQISMLYQFLSKDEHFQDAHINRVFNELWTKSFPFFEDDFLNIISIKAIQVAVEKKSIRSAEEQVLLNEFVPTFEKRMFGISKTASWIIILFLIGSIFFILWKISGLEEKFPLYIKVFFWAIGISGVGVLSVSKWRKNIADWIYKKIQRYFRFKS